MFTFVLLCELGAGTHPALLLPPMTMPSTRELFFRQAMRWSMLGSWQQDRTSPTLACTLLPWDIRDLPFGRWAFFSFATVTALDADDLADAAIGGISGGGGGGSALNSNGVCVIARRPAGGTAGMGKSPFPHVVTAVLLTLILDYNARGFIGGTTPTRTFPEAPLS
jgi:hypothetical protein